MTSDAVVKEQLRREIYAQLGQMTAEQVAEESRAIQACLKDYLLDRVAFMNTAALEQGRELQPLRVAVYHAMKGEADLHDLITDPELQAFVDFYLPRSIRDEGDLALHFGPWPKFEINRQPKNWVEAWYGAIEPPAHLANEGLDFDVVLLPCVAVSPYGERLGHGKGYYDRFLKTQAAETVKLAICLSPQAVNFHLPEEDHDHRLDGRVTASGCIEEAIDY